MAHLMLVTAIDERYVTPLRVMLASLLAHLSPDAQPTLHVIHRSLSPSARDAISRIVGTVFITPPAEITAQIPEHATLPLEAAFPLLLPDLLPDLDRVLFLDADTLVCDDVVPLWETELDGNAVGAVADGAVRLCSARRGVGGWKALGIPAEQRYFNGGILLADLTAWRARDIAQRSLSYMNSHHESLDFLHQEAMNATLWDDWLPLATRWNLLGSTAGRRAQPLSGAAAPPGIVHFAGRLKPWLIPIGGPFEAPYREQLARLGLSRPQPGVRRRLQSVYDRTVRDLTYPVERRLWGRGWL